MPRVLPVGKAVFANLRADVKAERVAALGAYLREVVEKAANGSEAQRTIAAFLNARD